MKSLADSSMQTSAPLCASTAETGFALADPISQYIRSEDFVPMMRVVFQKKLFYPIAEVYRYHQARWGGFWRRPEGRFGYSIQAITMRPFSVSTNRMLVYSPPSKK